LHATCDIFRPPALEKKLADMKKKAAEEVSNQKK
jgi:hypothetical protein